MERTNQGAPDPKIRGSVFTIQTQTRTYHLEADCESEMEKWVDAICSVCGLRATDENASFSGKFLMDKLYYLLFCKFKQKCMFLFSYFLN